MAGKSEVTRVKIRKGLHLVKRGHVWYAESCAYGRQERSHPNRARRSCAGTRIRTPFDGARRRRSCTRAARAA